MRARGVGSVYQRESGIWWIQYYDHGKLHRESSGSRVRSKAATLLKRRLAEMGRGRLIGPQAERLTVGDLKRMVLEDHAINDRKSAPPLSRLSEHFPDHTRALDITADRVTRYIQLRMAEGAAAATVRNEVAVLGRGFTLAFRAGLIPQRPYLPLPRVSNARTGFFTGDQIRALLKHLPEYLQPFVEVAYITGWRRGELRNLRWSQVDWETGALRLERGTTKSGEPRSFRFAEHPRLAELLREQRRRTTELEHECDVVCPWVFHRKGKQLAWHYYAWIGACTRAGLAGRKLHDLRRSAVRNLIRAGASEQVAMLITGHKTRSVFDRYHIVTSSDQDEATRKLAALHEADERRRGSVVAIEHLREEAQNEHNPRSKASRASARR